MKQKAGFFLVILLFFNLPFPSRADYLRYRMTIIENGGFESAEPDTESLGAYWLMKGRGDLPEIPRDHITNLDAYEGQYCLYVTRGDSIWQYLPGVQEYSDSLKICGAVKLTGSAPSVRLLVTSGDGLSVVYCMDPNPNPPQDDSLYTYIGVVIPTDVWTTFKLPAGIDFLNAFGENPLPRFTSLPALFSMPISTPQPSTSNRHGTIGGTSFPLLMIISGTASRGCGGSGKREDSPMKV